MSKQPTVLKNIYYAKWCEKHHLKAVAKFFMRLNAIVFNCHIDYHADVPRSTSLSHMGSGIVINGACKIGEKTAIAHGVTIGNRMPFHEGHPIIGANCYIGSGAYIGGGITLGDNVYVGANAVVIVDVPDNCTIVGNPGRIIYPENRKIKERKQILI